MPMCEVCGGEILFKRADARYCSERCSTKRETQRRRAKIRAARTPNVKRCAVCGSEFVAHVRNPYQLYCSETCMRLAMYKRSVESGRKKVNARQYRERHREQISAKDRRYHDEVAFAGNRERVYERDGYACRRCGSTVALVAHHIDWSGQSETPNQELDNLLTLCRACHAKEHHAGSKNVKYKDISIDEIRDALAKHGTVTATAEALGVTRKTLLKKRKAFGLPMYKPS